jgi:hypothetical protein
MTPVSELRLSVNRFVDVAFVATEDEAVIVSTNKLRNLLRGVPIEYSRSVNGTMSCTVDVPRTTSDETVVVDNVVEPTTVSVPDAFKFPPIF